MSLSTEKSELLQRWNSSKKALDWHKEEEAKLRAQVGMTVFPEAKKGATTIELGAGYRATYTVKINHKIGKPVDAPEKKTVVEAMDDLHNEMRQASNEGSFIFSRLVKFKPELSVSEYNKLPDNLRKIVDRYVTTSEGVPTLEIKEPAKGK